MIKVAALPALVVSRFALVILVAFLFSLFTLILLARPAHATSHEPSPSPSAECQVPEGATGQQVIDTFNKCAIKKNVFDDKVFNMNQIAGTTDSLYTILIGKSLLHPETDEVTQGKGAVAATGKLAMSLFSRPPVSGVDYFASQIQKFNPIQPAYAQGLGFTALTPVQGLWEKFRNVSYLGFVIVFVIIGFMIMFRAHISPQAVATVQDSLPRIVIALILVTFSYAIAGLMIDVMFLSINVAIKLLQPDYIGAGKENLVFEQSIIQITVHAWDNIVGGVAGALNNIIESTIDIGLGTIGDLIEWGLSGIGGLIAGIAMLFIMFRVFLMLLMAYVMILIMTLAAPFYFLIQALPGNNGAKEWFKQMAANVSVFPVVALMVLLAGALTGIGDLGGGGTAKIPDAEVLKFPLLVGGFEGDKIIKLIGFGILFMTPEAAKMIKEAIGAKGLGGGAGLGAGAAALGSGAGVLAAGGKRVGESRLGRAYSDIMEHRGREGSQRIINRISGTNAEGAPNILARGKLPK